MAKYKFQVVRGSHRVGATYSNERLPNGARRVVTPGYNVPTGGYVDSDVDLAKKYPSQPPKFVRIDRMVEQEEAVTDELSGMTRAELVEYAQAHEIDLDGCTTKAQILERLKVMLED